MDKPRWDLFCRVVDNLGDVGVCWRLAADLAARGIAVRLWIDDASALRWMAPAGADGVAVRDWAEGEQCDDETAVGDVVIEAFGCTLPATFVERMATRPQPPVWIDLEYLSAEAYVERSHGLASPQAGGPGAGLLKRFFFPGFTARSGGLLREPGLDTRQAGFDRDAWLASRGIERHERERVVTLFCYDGSPVRALADALGDRPTLLLAAFGAASEQVARVLGRGLVRGNLRAVLLPPLSQPDYDHLLWSGDCNFVRGEDSFVRAQWAGRPFVWQPYMQADGAHVAKREAFLARFVEGVDESLSGPVAALWRAWGEAPLPPSVDLRGLAVLPRFEPWQAHCLNWRHALRSQADLVTQLIRFARETR
jgi:uncharacterized repeat protein (TIGR03837 family)